MLWAYLWMTIGCIAGHIGMVQFMLRSSRRVRALQRVQPGRVYYVAANLLKAAVLAGCVLSYRWRQVAARGLNNLGTPQTTALPASDGVALQLFVALYAATDLAQFVTVRMAQSTCLHHAATSAFALYICLHNPQQALPPLANALLWYGFCSVLAFAVNAYLALRVLFGPDTPGMNLLRKGAALTYAMSLAVNWPVHTTMIFQAAPSCNFLLLAGYVSVTTIFTVDDLLLLRHLCKPMAAPEVVRALQEEARMTSGAVCRSSTDVLALHSLPAAVPDGPLVRQLLSLRHRHQPVAAQPQPRQQPRQQDLAVTVQS